MLDTALILDVIPGRLITTPVVDKFQRWLNFPPNAISQLKYTPFLFIIF
jgi:hypothetical protein